MLGSIAKCDEEWALIRLRSDETRAIFTQESPEALLSAEDD